MATASASPGSTPRTRTMAPDASAPPISAGSVQNDGLAAGVQLALGFELLQYAAGHLARAADEAGEFLPRDAQLRALWVAHRFRFAGQVVQRAHDAVGDVQEGEATGLAAGDRKSVV